MVQDLGAYIDGASRDALRSIVEAENAFILRWCKHFGCTPQELSERFDLRSETGADYADETLRFSTSMRLEPKKKSAEL